MVELTKKDIEEIMGDNDMGILERVGNFLGMENSKSWEPKYKIVERMDGSYWVYKERKLLTFSGGWLGGVEWVQEAFPFKNKDSAKEYIDKERFAIVGRHVKNEEIY